MFPIPKGAVYISEQSTAGKPVVIKENPLQKIDRLVFECFLPAVSALLQKDNRTNSVDINLGKVKHIPVDAVIDTQETDIQKNPLDDVEQKIYLLREYIGKLLQFKTGVSDHSIAQLTQHWSDLLIAVNKLTQNKTNPSQVIHKIDLQIQAELNNIRI